MIRLGCKLGFAVFLLSAAVAAQTPGSSALPDAPSAVISGRSRSGPVQVKEALASDPYLPLTNSEKRGYWLAQTHAPSTFATAVVDTAFTAATADFRFCCGTEAWGKQYAAVLADKEVRMFFGRYLFPTLLNQDPRYFPKREGSFISRAWYAATRVLVTRNDEGRNAFNTSEMLSVAFSKALCNAYYPERDRTFGRTARRIYGTMQSDAIGNLLNEFTPDIKRIFKRHTPKRLASIAGKVPFSHPASEAVQPLPQFFRGNRFSF